MQSIIENLWYCQRGREEEELTGVTKQHERRPPTLPLADPLAPLLMRDPFLRSAITSSRDLSILPR
jgi:hypothetical protein